MHDFGNVDGPLRDSRVNHCPGSQSSKTIGRSLNDVSDGIEHTNDDVRFRPSEPLGTMGSEHIPVSNATLHTAIG